MSAKSIRASSNLGRRSRYVSLAFAALLFSLRSPEIFAGTFYVDSATGSDRNSGLTKTSAWKSIPGTDGAIRWGTFNSENKIPAGTTIEIKAGALFSGKRWVIDKTFFQSGTATRPVTIRVSPSWGSGNVVFDGRGAIVPIWQGGVQITELSYVVIAGADAFRRIEIKNYLAHANILHYNRSNNGAAVGNQLKWFDCHHSSNYCVDNSWQDNLLYEDGIAHNNGALEGDTAMQGTGIIMGDVNDATGKNNIIRRVTSYRNGSNSKSNDGSMSFGFQITGGEGTRFESCEAFENGRDGFDAGRVDNAGDASMTFINTYSHDNREDGFGLSSGPTGNVNAVHINTIASNNGQANWTVYDGAHIEIYHAAARASAANFHTFRTYRHWPAATIKIRNSYLSTSPSAVQIKYYKLVENGNSKFDSDYNVWVPNTSDNEFFDDNKLNKYSIPPNWRGTHDKFGISFLEAILNLSAQNPGITTNGGKIRSRGIYLSSPNGVNIDRNGTARANSPAIGPFSEGPEDKSKSQNQSVR